MADSSQSEVPEAQGPTGAPGAAPGAEPGTTIQLAGFQLWLSKNRERVFRLGLITFVIGFVIVGVTLWLTGNLNTENIGYGGVWIIGFVAAGSIILPIPGPAAVCIAAAPDLGLTPLYIGVVSASAEALGEMTGYMAGLSGRSFLERSKHYPKFHSLLVRRGGIILFVGAAIPNPLFDVLGIAAGSIGYPIKRFLGVVFIGKAIKSTGIAYLCFWGIDSFARWLG
ncbi:MAG: VTT domain-containing protein [Chloroflexi bacterium]|nr:VTT domain-containing protein [Chloroflexota bacterium]